VQPIKDKEGDISMLMVISYDITERKKAEEKLRQTENLLNRVQELAHFASFERDLINNSFERSDELYRIFGITHDEFGSQGRLSQWVHPDDRDYVEKQLKLMLSGNSTGQVEFRIIRPDGEERFISSNADIIFDGNSMPVKIMGYVQDITERKMAEEELQQSEYLLSQAQELAHLGSYEWDIVNDRIERSDELFRIIGITREEVAPEERLTQYIHADDRDNIVKGYQSMKAGHSIGPKELRIIRPDGEERVVFANEDVILDDSGVPVKSIGYLLDITERKKAEKERDQLILELKHALNNIKTLKGLLPICSNCKKIRTDKGYWSQIEVYIQSHTDALFTHSICPVCIEKLYGDEDWHKEIHNK
ncbi:MAG: PAS domain S-box protein, partial [Desulfobacterium sp.]|nr:PAS domain S-box protein [Desulfobacterium sp.]